MAVATLARFATVLIRPHIPMWTSRVGLGVVPALNQAHRFHHLKWVWHRRRQLRTVHPDP